MRARFLNTCGLAVALGLLLGDGQTSERAQADDARREAKRGRDERIMGEHELSVAAARPGLTLALRRGIEVKLLQTNGHAPVALRVAKVRAISERIAPGFVPIGPTIQLLLAEGSVDVSFVADQFHVRAGHRLVLAREGAVACASPECWQLLPAAYAHGRCTANAVSVHGGRMQFGSLPAP